MLGDQIVVVAPLDDAALLQDHDGLRVADRGEAVGDDEYRPARHQAVHALFDELFRAGVDGTRGLIEDQHRGIGAGGNLSQGERQLLNIARAACANPPVLILDEATSSIDTRTEKLIEKGMDRLMAGRTVFVIAHRLSTVRNAKAIMVLEQGSIIERGDHDDLIAQHGRYYQLYTGQAELS